MNRHSKTTTIGKWTALVMISIITLGACNSGDKPIKNDEDNDTKVPTVSNEELKRQLDSLKTNMTVAWDSMMRSDQEKMKSILRYIDEVAYIPGSDEEAVAELKNLYNEIDKMDYDMSNFPSKEIDRFDSLQTLLIKKTIALGSSTPGNEKYPLIKELTNEINQLDNILIINRGNYDEFSIPFNCALINQADQVKELGPPYSEMKKVVVFMLKPSCEPMEVIDADSIEDWKESAEEEVM